MRLNQIFFKPKNHARIAQNEDKVLYKPVRPLRLKNSITSAAKKTLDDKCLFEMQLLFKCWKDNEFNESTCQAYVKSLQDCYVKLMKNTARAKELQNISVPTPGATSYTNKQLSYLLRQYPTV